MKELWNRITALEARVAELRDANAAMLSGHMRERAELMAELERMTTDRDVLSNEGKAWADRYVARGHKLLSAEARIRELTEQSESWRRGVVAWQSWAESVILPCNQPDGGLLGDGPARECIGDELRSLRADQKRLAEATIVPAADVPAPISDETLRHLRECGCPRVAAGAAPKRGGVMSQTLPPAEPAPAVDPLQSFDAQVWVRELLRIHSGKTIGKAPDGNCCYFNEGDALAWFANALMRGFDEHARQVRASAVSEPAPSLVEQIEAIVDEHRALARASFGDDIMVAKSDGFRAVVALLRAAREAGGR